jgi:hypothetical protein
MSAFFAAMSATGALNLHLCKRGRWRADHARIDRHTDSLRDIRNTNLVLPLPTCRSVRVACPRLPKNGAARLTARQAWWRHYPREKRNREALVMRVKIAIAVAVALAVVVAGCSRPWTKAELAPLNPQPYGQGRYSNSYDPPSRSSDPYASSQPRYSDPYTPSQPRYSDPYASSQYGRVPSSNGYERASPSNPYGTGSKSNQYNY